MEELNFDMLLMAGGAEAMPATLDRGEVGDAGLFLADAAGLLSRASLNLMICDVVSS